MNKGSPSTFRRAPLMFFTALFAVLLIVAATGLWHTHSSAQEAASCTVCHVGSTPTQPQPVSTALAPPVFTVEGIVVLPVFSGHSEPIFSSKSPRAPPVAS
ncbi:MAG TPA: hypothetical protein VIH72_04395 [Candidatus Acidoferrales bacterium]